MEWPLAVLDPVMVGLVLFTIAVAVAIHRVQARLKLMDILFSDADPDSIRHGGELVANVLTAHGVKFVFTLCGGHISPVLVSCEKVGIRVIDTRHEVTCVFAADAVARLSGVIGVACVTAGPGLTNTITAVKNASMAESPVLLLGGAAATIMKGRGSLQDIDQISLFKPLCKYVGSVTQVKEIIPTLRKAIQIAQSGVPGPVFVELPIDTLYPYETVAREIMPKTKSKSFGAKLLSWYLQSYLKKLYAGAWRPRALSPLPVTIPFARKSEISRCASLIRNSKKPVFLLGSQATLPPTKPDDLRAAFEKMGIPCFLGGMARGLLGRDNPIHIRQRRREALKESDVIVMIGAVADFRLSYGRALGQRAKIVAVNRSWDSLKLNTDAFWKGHMYIRADPGSFAASLSEELADYSCSSEWVGLLHKRDQDKEEGTKKKAKQELPKHLNPLHVLYLTEEIMSDNSIIVTDGGDFVGSASYILRPRGPMCWLDPGAFGTLGVGGGFALGAKLVRPDADVWIVYGDGSLGYSIAEFDTFTRHNAPVIALVGNDACWTQIAREQIPMFRSDVACILEYCDYDRVASGFGGYGYKLDKGVSQDELYGTIENSQHLSRKGRPVLINCLVGRTDFRDGSISV